MKMGEEHASPILPSFWFSYVKVPEESGRRKEVVIAAFAQGD